MEDKIKNVESFLKKFDVKENSSLISKIKEAMRMSIKKQRDIDEQKESRKSLSYQEVLDLNQKISKEEREKEEFDGMTISTILEVRNEVRKIKNELKTYEEEYDKEYQKKYIEFCKKVEEENKKYQERKEQAILETRSEEESRIKKEEEQKEKRINELTVEKEKGFIDEDTYNRKVNMIRGLKIHTKDYIIDKMDANIKENNDKISEMAKVFNTHKKELSKYYEHLNNIENNIEYTIKSGITEESLMNFENFTIEKQPEIHQPEVQQESGQQSEAQQQGEQQASEQQPGAQQQGEQQISEQQQGEQQSGVQQASEQQPGGQQYKAQQASGQQSGVQQQGGQQLQHQMQNIYSNSFDTVEAISINAKEGKAYVTLIKREGRTQETKELDIEDILENKKEIFKNANVDELLKEAGANSRFERFLTRRKINPIILKALEINPQLSYKYIEAVLDEKEFPFDYKIDLTNSILSKKSNSALNKLALKERKIEGNEVVGVKRLYKIRNLFKGNKKTKAIEGAEEQKALPETVETNKKAKYYRATMKAVDFDRDNKEIKSIEHVNSDELSNSEKKDRINKEMESIQHVNLDKLSNSEKEELGLDIGDD